MIAKTAKRLPTKVELSKRPDYNSAEPSGQGEPRTESKMSTLPLTLKKQGVVERHQVEGNDPSDRYFNRAILVSRTANGYTAKVTYEALTVEGQTYSAIGAAVKSAVEKLQELGFRRLRTRLNFRGQRYLAEKETWVEYQDPG